MSEEPICQGCGHAKTYHYEMTTGEPCFYQAFQPDSCECNKWVEPVDKGEVY